VSEAATPEAREVVERVYRAESRRVLASLIRLLGDFDRAEEALHDAFVAALQQWPESGVPANPRAWLVSAGRFKAIDAARRSARFDASQGAIVEGLELRHAAQPELDDESLDDDWLRLIFTCCHPALSPDARIALTLREVCDLTTEQVARAFLSTPPTIAQRIVRAKAKIRDAGIPYAIPTRADMPERLDEVLHVVYLVFNEGYAATSGDAVVRGELTREAIRLGRLLLELMPQEPEVLGLLALMLLVDARRAARTDAGGNFVKLDQQDRGTWDPSRIAEGQALLRVCLERNLPGPYQLQAAINAVHSDAADAAHTDWRQILALYDQLMGMAPGPVVALNRAVVVAELHGAARGLELVDALDLPRYHLFHAVRADLLRRLARPAEAAAAYRAAIEHCGNAREKHLLEKQLGALTPAAE